MVHKSCNMNIERMCTKFCSFKNIKAKLWHWFLFFCCSSAYSCICRESRQWLTAGEHLESGLGLVQGESTKQLSKIHYVFTCSCLPFEAVVIIFKSQLLLSHCRTISLCCNTSRSAGVLSVDFHCSRSLNREGLLGISLWHRVLSPSLLLPWQPSLPSFTNILQDGVWPGGGLVVMYLLGLLAWMVRIYNKCGEKLLLDVTAQKQPQTESFVAQMCPRQDSSVHPISWVEACMRLFPIPLLEGVTLPVCLSPFAGGSIRELQRAGLSVWEADNWIKALKHATPKLFKSS